MIKRRWTKAYMVFLALSAVCAAWTACFMLVSGYAWVVPLCLYSAYHGGLEARRTWREGTR